MSKYIVIIDDEHIVHNIITSYLNINYTNKYLVESHII